MITVVPYLPEHALALDPPAQYPVKATPALAAAVAGPFARTALLDGKPIGCGGLTARWLENWVAWAYLDKAAGAQMLPLSRAIAKTLPDLPKGRIEAIAPADYRAACRWLELLGFRCETPNGMAHYTPDGRTFMLYSRMN